MHCSALGSRYKPRIDRSRHSSLRYSPPACLVRSLRSHWTRELTIGNARWAPREPRKLKSTPSVSSPVVNKCSFLSSFEEKKRKKNIVYVAVYREQFRRCSNTRSTVFRRTCRNLNDVYRRFFFFCFFFLLTENAVIRPNGNRVGYLLVDLRRSVARISPVPSRCGISLIPWRTNWATVVHR